MPGIVAVGLRWLRSQVRLESTVPLWKDQFSFGGGSGSFQESPRSLAKLLLPLDPEKAERIASAVLGFVFREKLQGRSGREQGSDSSAWKMFEEACPRRWTSCEALA